VNKTINTIKSPNPRHHPVLPRATNHLKSVAHRHIQQVAANITKLSTIYILTKFILFSWSMTELSFKKKKSDVLNLKILLIFKKIRFLQMTKTGKYC